MVEWGVLNESGRRGAFRPGPPIAVPEDGAHAGWLIEAALIASDRQSMRLGSLVRHPMLFPFRNFATARDAVARKHLELFREGSGEEVVGLKYRPAGVR